jgi:hypothetical protein
MDGHRKPFEQWDVAIEDHQLEYIVSRVRTQPEAPCGEHLDKPGDVKSGHIGRALLPRILLCGHCGWATRGLHLGRSLVRDACSLV